MSKNFPNLGRDLDIQVHEAKNSPQNFNPQLSPSRDMLIKLPKIKDKERILKAVRENFSHTRKLPESYQWISQETLQTRKEWDDRFKILKEKLTSKNTLPSKAVLQK